MSLRYHTEEVIIHALAKRLKEKQETEFMQQQLNNLRDRRQAIVDHIHSDPSQQNKLRFKLLQLIP